MSVWEADRLRAAAGALTAAIPEPNSSQSERLGAIARLVARLNGDIFQLAVVGQFKRGKSTLVNALAGCPVLATGVLPLTAEPTFLRRGEAFGLTSIEDGRELDRIVPEDIGRLAELVARATTRAAGVNAGGSAESASRRIEVSLPAPGTLLDDIVLIDTPGIGSTDRRSTATARAALPECDAALFVVSVDPPITELEMDHLVAVAGQTEAIVFVLNKADLVDADELASLLSFFAAEVSQVAGVPAEPRVFAVSAKAALRARQSGDAEAMTRSGLLELEDHLRTTLVRRKRTLLRDAVARGMLAIVCGLERDALVEQRSLTLPMAELDDRIGRLDQAEAEFARERIVWQDRLAGDWRRAIADIEAFCGATESRIAAELADLLAVAPACAGVQDLSDLVGRRMAECLEREFAATVRTVNDRSRKAFEQHRAHHAALVAAVRQASSEIMNVAPPVALPVAVEDLKAAFKPFWIGRAEIDSLGSLTADAFGALLPPRWRKARERRRLGKASSSALRRNVTQLHWSAKQAIDDLYRAQIASLPGATEASLGATRDIAAAVRLRRREQDRSLENSQRRLTQLLAQLADVREHIACSF